MLHSTDYVGFEDIGSFWRLVRKKITHKLISEMRILRNKQNIKL